MIDLRGFYILCCLFVCRGAAQQQTCFDDGSCDTFNASYVASGALRARFASLCGSAPWSNAVCALAARLFAESPLTKSMNQTQLADLSALAIYTRGADWMNTV